MSQARRFLKVSFIVGWWTDQDEMGNDYDHADASVVILPYTRRCIDIAMRGIRRAFKRGLAEGAGVVEVDQNGRGGWIAAYFERDGGEHYPSLDAAIEHGRAYLRSAATE